MRPIAILFLTVVTVMASCAPPPSAQIEANKDLVQRFGDALNAADWDALDELVTDDFTRHCQATPGVQVESREDFIELQKGFLTSAPDQRVTMQKMVAEGDEVAVLAVYSGTHTGPMGDFPITGKSFECVFLAFFRVEGDRIAELWVEWDNVAMLSQLGLFPPPSGS